MLKYILVFFVLFNLASSEVTLKLKKTSSTTAINMKSDDFKKSAYASTANALSDGQGGFYINNLEKVSGDLPSSGFLGVLYKEGDNETHDQAYCTGTDLSAANQGVTLICITNSEFDSIKIKPKTDGDTPDTIEIEGYADIKISNSMSSNNGHNMICPSTKFILTAFALLLVI